MTHLLMDYNEFCVWSAAIAFVPLSEQSLCRRYVRQYSWYFKSIRLSNYKTCCFSLWLSGSL